MYTRPDLLACSTVAPDIVYCLQSTPRSRRPTRREPQRGGAVAQQPRVVVFDPIPGDWSFAEEADALARRGVELIVPATPEEADEAIRDATAVIVTGVRRLDADRIAGLRDAVGILCYSIGMDKVDGPAAQAAGLVVRNVPDYCTDEVSDHALTLLLAAERRLVPIASA